MGRLPPCACAAAAHPFLTQIAALPPARLLAHAAPLLLLLLLLQDTTEATRLEFLPHHFLLCSVGTTGVLRYQDTSTGQVVATHRTKQGPCDAMRQNPWNAALCLGHGNGTVTMWTPNISTPAVRMLCHHGPVRSLAADAQGRHLVTTGTDGQASHCNVPPALVCSAMLCAACMLRCQRAVRY